MSTRALWYLTRGAGVVSLLLLSGVVVMGVLATVRWARPAWPRFASQHLHRNLSLLAIVFVGIHVVTAITDPFAPLRVVDAVFPFVSRYRPVWVGLGAVAFDLLVALVVSSLLRLRLGYRSWRALHWIAYACWPVAVVHGLGTGSDIRQRWMQLVTVACAGAVLASIWWRIAHRWPTSAGRRVVAGVASVVAPALILAFTVTGPLKPGWARRSGTPASILAGASATTGAVPASAPPTADGRLPATAGFRGTVTQRSRSDGSAAVTISGRLTSAGRARLAIVIVGQPLNDGGVAMSSSSVTLDDGGARYIGAVRTLTGDVVNALLRGSRRSYDLQLALTLQGNTAAGSARLTAVS